MSELTKEYFDGKFEEFALMIGEGFAETATKDELKRLPMM